MLETLWLLYRREMRSTLRERNVLLYVVAIPLMLYPFLLWLAIAGFSVMAAEEERTPVRVVVTPADSDFARILARHKQQYQVNLVESAHPEEALSRAQLDAWVRFEGTGKVRLVYDGRFRQSRRAQKRLLPVLRQFREVKLEELALQKGVPLSELQPYFVGERRDEGSSSELGRNILGVFLPLTLLVMLSLGGLYPAVETTAGEHERQTVDTTLGLSVSRWQLVVSKYAMVSSLCCLSGIFNLLALTFSLRSIMRPIFESMTDQIHWSWSLHTLMVVTTGIISMSMLVAALTMLVTSNSRSFRQGQATTTPLFIGIMFPALAVIDRNLALDGHSCWVPVINIALLWRDSLTTRVPTALVLATLVFSLFWVIFTLFILTLRMRYQGKRFFQHPAGRGKAGNP